MSGTLRLVLILLATVFAGYFAVKVATAVLGFVLSLLIPVVALAVIVGVLYVVSNRKSLGSGRRRTLP